MENFKFLAVSILVFLFSIKIMNPIREKVADTGSVVLSSRFCRDRALQLFDSFSHIPADRPLILVFGGSSVEAFMDSADLEKKLKDRYLVLNIGMRDLHPQKLSWLARRLKIELKKRNLRVAASFLKLESTNLTQRYSKQPRGARTILDFISATSTESLIRDELLTDPSMAFRIVVNRFLFNSTTADYLLVPLTNQFLPPKSNNLFLRAFTPWTKPEFSHKKKWDLESRGQYILRQDATSQFLFEKARSDKQSQQLKDYMWRYFDQYTDIRNRKWSELLLKTYSGAIQEIQSFSERVIIFDYPEDDLKKYTTDQSTENMKWMGNHLRSLGVEYHDLSGKVIFESSDYFDFLHLSDTGQKKLNNQLAHLMN